jgi:hypothetical protein
MTGRSGHPALAPYPRHFLRENEVHHERPTGTRIPAANPA